MMETELEITGERFMPGQQGDIRYEHLHRYRLAQAFVKDRVVLDLACGEGYGAALLSQSANSVFGIDIDEQIIRHASARYATCRNLEFRVGSCSAIPLPDASVDVVTSFETIEHQDRHQEMMLELKRALRPEGILIISSPNRPVYSEQFGFNNPFHVKELDYEEFEVLLKQHFKHVQVYGQKLAAGSLVFPLNGSKAHSYTTYAENGGFSAKAPRFEPVRYFVAVCSDARNEVAKALNSIYLDGDDLFQQILDELNIRRAQEQQQQQIANDQKEQRVASHQEAANNYEQHKLMLDEIRASFSFRIVSGLIWPLSRLIPVLIRSQIKRTLRRIKSGFRRSPTAEGEQQLCWKINTDLSQPFVVGRGNLLYLSGRCFHTVKRIKRLSVMVDGVSHPVFNHSLAEPEAAGARSQLSDHTGNSLIGGFWATVPFEKVDAPREAKLSLRATLEDGRVDEAQIGTLKLLPSEPLEQSIELMPGKADSPASPRVIICMATYNPPLDLFVRQIESIIKQKHDNWACIISDDCSEAQTFEEMRRIAAQDSRFSVYRNPERLGFYRNFERCLKLVPAGAADFIAFSDQDDEWYEDKLASCLKEFDEDDVQMVYSDMDIVTREGKVLSHTFWTTRRNNYTNLETLLLANTVAGASVVFRSGLLDDLLPFPQMRDADLFHDHWVACVALTRGRIGYVDRPLYGYRQHANNVIGHVAVPVTRLWPEFKGLAYTWSLLARGENDPSQNLSHLCNTYRALPVRISFIAAVLSLRLKDAPAKKRAVLKKFARFEYSLAALTRQALKYLLTRRPTFGIELISLRVTLSMRLFKSYFHQDRRQLVARMNGSFAPAQAETAQVSDASPAVDASPVVDFVRQKIAPLRLNVSRTTERRVNLLVSTVDAKYLFAGNLSVFNLALRLNASGYATRLVIVDDRDCDLEELSRRMESHDGLRELFKKIETAYVSDRSIPLEVSLQDAFIATSWWTAHIAHHAARELGRSRFIYLIQDYEPLFYPGGSFYALAEQALTFPHDALFSTDMLRDYFREQRLGVYANDGAEARAPSPVIFQNAVKHFEVSENRMRERKRRRLLFYARPEATYFARNMFELGVLALRQAISEGHFDLQRWEFDGMGAINRYSNVPLCADAELKMLPKLSLEDYYQALPNYDLGLSLMHTPHPSLTPLDMAAAGLVTITNTFAAKTAARMSEISGNIIAVPPTIEDIRKGLIDALSEVEDFEKRAQGARLNWSRSWEETFGADVIAAVKQSVGW